MSDGVGVGCGALPIPTVICPACGHGIKPSRGWTWIEPDLALEGYLGPHDDYPNGVHSHTCPLGAPGRLGERCGLLWIGEQHYATPEDWVQEGMRMGFSRRIRNVPNGFVAGETWVLAAHRKAIPHGYRVGEKEYADLNDVLALAPDTDVEDVEVNYIPGIFHVWRPTRIEYVVRGDETDEELEALEARGIEPVKVVVDEREELPV